MFITYRFLKARKFDVEKAKHMWSEMLRWRNEFGVDNIEVNSKLNHEPREKVCYLLHVTSNIDT